MTAGCSDELWADELREYVTGALNLIEPWLWQIRERQPDTAAAEPTSCATCPLCAALTVLRGGRSELAARLAEQLSALAGVLRTALAEGAGTSAPSAAPMSRLVGPAELGAEFGDERQVQRIPVARGEGGVPSAPR